MKEKNNNSQDNYYQYPTTAGEAEIKEYKYPISRFDYDLFDEEKATPAPVIRVKRTNTSTKGERWKVLRNEELLLIIEGNKLSKKEREYLRSLEGVSFLTKQVKMNITSFNKLRAELKAVLKVKY